MDFRDWFIVGCVSASWAAGTVFIFKFGSAANAAALMAAWGAVCATMTGAYHWIVMRDQKVKDA